MIGLGNAEIFLLAATILASLPGRKSRIPKRRSRDKPSAKDTEINPQFPPRRSVIPPQT